MDEHRLTEGRWTMLHAGRNRSKADVYRVELAGKCYAVKDYRRCAWPIRLTLGRWSLSHEASAYEALQGVAGIPVFVGRPHPYLLTTEFIEATSLAQWGRLRPLPPGFFGRLKSLRERIHQRGVAHGDLHHRDVLIDAAGEVSLVDFSTSLCSTGEPARRSWLWRRMAERDRHAVLKLQERYEPGTLSADEARELQQERRAYRWARMLGRRLRGRSLE